MINFTTTLTLLRFALLMASQACFKLGELTFAAACGSPVSKPARQKSRAAPRDVPRMTKIATSSTINSAMNG